MTRPEPGTTRGVQQRVEVVRIIARMNIGGPAIHIMNLTEGQSTRRPTVLVTGAVDEGEADLAPEAQARGLAVVLIPELGRAVKPWDDLVAVVKLTRLLRRLRPTVVDTHTAKAGTLGRIAAVLAGVPVRVHTFHGHVFHGYFGPVTTRIFVWIERVLGWLTTQVVTVSEGQADELGNVYAVCRRDRIRVISLGTDLARFSGVRGSPLRDEFRAELGAEDHAVVTIVGRLAPIKNHELFFQMARRLVASGQRCVFAVVGGGSEERRLRTLARELGLEPFVRFLGWRSDLERIYAGSDVVALTSRNEGTPLALIEALAAGCAVVATDVGGVGEVLERGRLGILVPPDDADALAREVGGLLRSPERRDALGRLGEEEAPKRYGTVRLVQDMDALYDELLSRRASGAGSAGR